MGKLALLAIAVISVGCHTASNVECATGAVCPGDMVCSPNGGTCVDSAQIEACVPPLGDGDSCTWTGGSGLCSAGVCLSSGCGDGETRGGEVCDDGNAESGDGCRADCRKVEACGDGQLDQGIDSDGMVQGETCDDGNINPADGCDGCRAAPWSVNTPVGGGRIGDAVAFVFPLGVAVDRDGRVYVADADGSRVWVVDPATGAAAVVAGTGDFGYNGDGGPATESQLDSPTDVAIDGLGNVYIADSFNHRIRKVAYDTGYISTVAGSGTDGDNGDGPGTSIHLSTPFGIAVDGIGAVYIADTFNSKLRRLDPVTGNISTVGTTAFPFDIVPDGDGGVYASNGELSTVVHIDAAGVVVTVAGDGVAGNAGDDGQATAARLDTPAGIALDGDGNLLISDTANHRIRRVDLTTGVIATVVGTGSPGKSGDGGAALLAQLWSPFALAVSTDGTLYIADSDNRQLRAVSSTDVVRSVSGGGGPTADGELATAATLPENARCAVGGLGNLAIAFPNRHQVWRVDSATGLVETVAGGAGLRGFSGDGGAGVDAQLTAPRMARFDDAGNVYIADTDNHRVRRVAPSGTITTIAGMGSPGTSGDGGPATSASLTPFDVIPDSAGNLYIVDGVDDVVRRVDAGGTISTIITDAHIPSFAGESAALAPNGDLYLTSREQVWKWTAPSGPVSLVAGVGTQGNTGDGGLAVDAEFQRPSGVAVNANGTVYIADSGNDRIRVVDGDGNIWAFAGNGNDEVDGEGGADGDGGPATAATIGNPTSLSVDAAGNLYVRHRRRVRRIDATTGLITTVAGRVDPPGMGAAPVAALANPQALAWTEERVWVAGGSSGTVQSLQNDLVTAVAGRYPEPASMANLSRYRGDDFGDVGGVAWDASTLTLYMSVSTDHSIHAVHAPVQNDPSTWTSVVGYGDGTPGYADAPGTGARFQEPTGLFLDTTTDTLYVADTGNHAIRAITLATGAVTTVAGVPRTIGYGGDGDAPTTAFLNGPRAITVCPNGDLFIADTGNNRVRRVADGVISTVIGDGSPSSAGEGVPARGFPVNAPRGVACDSLGNVFASSSTSVRLLPAHLPVADDGSPPGIVDGNGSVLTIYGAYPRDEFPALITRCLTGVAVTDADAVQVADSCTGLLVELTRAP